MKLSSGIKNVLVKKLSDALMLKMNPESFNEVFIFLDRCDGVLKAVPYGIFENEDNLENLKQTDAGIVFGKWLNKTTCNIEIDFNKSRKLVRQFKSMVSTHQDSLAFNLSANNIFVVSLTSLFVPDLESVSFDYPVKDTEQFIKCLNTLRDYLAAIFFIDLVNDPVVSETIISLFINGDIDSLIERVIELGLIYNETWVG
jgi:hypothetical protein